MSKLVDLTAQRFGRLTVIERAEDSVKPCGSKVSRWLCRCDCGNEAVVIGTNLTRDHTKSCGCLQKEIVSKSSTKHGQRKTRLYNIWTKMKERCNNPKSVSYPMYGQIGITVCNEWLHNFQEFYGWAIANNYRDDLSIDRIDGDKGYSPDNCRWITVKEQARNRRTNRNITINGETKTLTEWCELYRLSFYTVRTRIRRGWLPEEALGIVSRKKTE